MFPELVWLARFVTGRLVTRELGPWDATFGAWAPPAPLWVRAQRGAVYPRTTWQRRPGWHRAAVRLSLIAAVTSFVTVPALTIVLTAVGGCTAAVWALRRLRAAGLIDREARAREAAEAAAALFDSPAYGWLPPRASGCWPPGTFAPYAVHPLPPPPPAVPLWVPSARDDEGGE